MKETQLGRGRKWAVDGDHNSGSADPMWSSGAGMPVRVGDWGPGQIPWPCSAIGCSLIPARIAKLEQNNSSQPSAIPESGRLYVDNPTGNRKTEELQKYILQSGKGMCRASSIHWKPTSQFCYQHVHILRIFLFNAKPFHLSLVSFQVYRVNICVLSNSILKLQNNFVKLWIIQLTPFSND